MYVTDATSLPQAMACHGSRFMQPSAAPDNSDPTMRDEGNAAHWLAEQLFNGVPVTVGDKAFNGVFITDEMVEHVNEYLSMLDCGQMEADTSHGGAAYLVKGRADHIGYNAQTGVLSVDDFKYGWRIVEPIGNWTLISHAVGYCINYQIVPRIISMTIHQPRPWHRDGHHRTWSIDYPTLLEYAARIAETLTNPRNELTTGEHCRKCPALLTCPAATQAGYNSLDVMDTPFNDQLDNEQLAHRLRLFKKAQSIIDAQVKALEELGKHRLTKGAVLPGFTLERQLANTRWRSTATADVIEVLTGIRPVKETMLTPGQAAKLGVPDVVISSMTERPITGHKLVELDADQAARKLLQRSK